MTSSTRLRVSSLSKVERLITRLTVFFETPERRATSLIVGFPDRRRPLLSSALLLTPVSRCPRIADPSPRQKRLRLAAFPRRRYDTGYRHDSSRSSRTRGG